MDWTGPNEIRAEVQKAWDRGRILAARVGGEPLFPMTVRTRRPERRALSERFDDVRRWIRALEEGSRARTGAGYEIGWTEIDHRQLGRNRVPDTIVVPTESDALHLIGKQRAADRFDRLAARTLESLPSLRPWLATKPLKVLEHADAWPRIVAVLEWLRANPRPGVYLRQLDIPGVDTKFIEARRGLISELLEQVLPPEAIEPSASSFEARFGLRAKPATIRFRILDPRHAIGGLTDLAVPVAQLAAHPPTARRVFITENEVNGLAFPPVDDALVVFGLGYGLDALAELAWLREREIHYWGDIDTHGFAILDRLRASFPHARSMLMDRETLVAHEALWVEEGSRHPGPLARLDDDERALFEELVGDRLGERVRLEQERVGFGCVVRALGAVVG